MDYDDIEDIKDKKREKREKGRTGEGKSTEADRGEVVADLIRKRSNIRS